MKQLKSIWEFQKYYEEDDGLAFESSVINFSKIYSSLSKKSQLHLATIRALEITNGIVQYSFRDGQKYALSVERTRECMKTSLGCIYSKKINGVLIDQSLIPILDMVRDIYNKGFKNGDEGSMKTFYAHSAAQFLSIPPHIMKDAIKMIRNNFTHIFTEMYIDSMQSYINRFYETPFD